TPEAFERFKSARAEARIEHAWLHCSYLVNLAHADDEQRAKSIDAVVNALTVAHHAGARGVVLHTGSHRRQGLEAVLPRVAAALERVFSEAPGETVLALENAAGQGGTIGGTFAELGAILKAAPTPRLGVC